MPGRETELRAFDVNQFLTRCDGVSCVDVSDEDLNRLSIAEVSRMSGLEEEIRRLHVKHEILRRLAAQRMELKSTARPDHERGRPKPPLNSVAMAPVPKKSSVRPLRSVSLNTPSSPTAFPASVSGTADFEAVMNGRQYYIVESNGKRRKGRWLVEFLPSNRVEWQEVSGKETGGTAEWGLLQGVLPQATLQEGGVPVPWRVLELVWAAPEGGAGARQKGLPCILEALSDEDYRSTVLVLQYFLRLSGKLRGKPSLTYEDLVALQQTRAGRTVRSRVKSEK